MRLDPHFGMLPERAFKPVGKRMTLEGKDSPSPPPAPDYSQMAGASVEAARLGKELGESQLAEAKRQYDLNKAVVDPVVASQLGLMKQTKEQGDDYYKYMQDTFRPLEKGMVDTAGREGSDARLEEMAGQATADMRRGQTQQANMMARQGLRYGYSPAKMAMMAGQMAGANASAVAGAATGARNQQRNIGWARQMDAAGLGRNLSGASLGAYGLSNNSGNSAVANSMAPGGMLMSGMAQGAGMQQTGQGQRIQGLGGILNAQTSAYGQGLQAESNGGGGLGALLGAGAQLGAAGIQYGGWFGSDRRLKEDIVLVGKDERTGLNLYEFAYKDSDGTRYRGVMADEVEPRFPAAVVYDDIGFASVNYGMLGIQMVEV